MALSNLEDLLVHFLQDMYFAEQQIVKALPKLTKNASDGELQDALKEHLAETKTQVERLEQAFDILGEEASGEECPAIEGLLEETEDLMEEIDDDATRDAAIVAAAQAVEHYEITRYGTILTLAEQLGHDDVVTILRDTLAEEKNADELLSRLAESRINAAAAES